MDVFSLSSDSLKSELIIDTEIRPRAEYKNHYRLSGTGDFNPDFYIIQRNRLCITYRYKDILYHTSPLDIHLWNREGTFSSIGSINLFELYLELRFSNPIDSNAGPYRAFENDLSFEYKPVKNINIRYGLSYRLASESMRLLGKIEVEKTIPVWSNLMVSFHPEILHVKNVKK